MEMSETTLDFVAAILVLIVELPFLANKLSSSSAVI